MSAIKNISHHTAKIMFPKCSLFHTSVMLCHEFPPPLPRQFLKVSANVIQFKAFNVSSMGHATFSTFVLASSVRQGRNMMNTFHQCLIFMTNCNCILFHYLRTIFSKQVALFACFMFFLSHIHAPIQRLCLQTILLDQ